MTRVILDVCGIGAEVAISSITNQNELKRIRVLGDDIYNDPTYESWSDHDDVWHNTLPFMDLRKNIIPYEIAIKDASDNVLFRSESPFKEFRIKTIPIPYPINDTISGFLGLGVREKGEWEVSFLLQPNESFNRDRLTFIITNIGIGEGGHGLRFLSGIEYELQNGKIISQQIEQIPSGGGGNYLEPMIGYAFKHKDVYTFYSALINRNEKFHTRITWGNEITEINEKREIDELKVALLKQLESSLNGLGQHSIEKPEFNAKGQVFDEIDYL